MTLYDTCAAGLCNDHRCAMYGCMQRKYQPPGAVPFNAQQEIADLKRRMRDFEERLERVLKRSKKGASDE